MSLPRSEPTVLRLKDKIALITGVGGGMGRAAAIRFAAEGATVVGCDLVPDASEETAELVRAAGGEMTVFAPVQLTDFAETQEWVNAAARLHGGFDVLYNNASSNHFGAIDELSVEDWDFTIANELNLVFYGCKAAWPHLVRRGGGVIVNVGSIAGTGGVEFMAQNAHGTAKAGVINLTQQLAVEGGPHRIQVVCVSPGFIVTPSTAWLVDQGPPALRRNLERIPLGRPGRAEDVVNAVVFLASDEAEWITGVNLVVDGGGSVFV